MKVINVGGKFETSAISLGCMRMGSLNQVKIDAIMDTALENGVKFFDHADIHGKGNCEKVFGEYMKNADSVMHDGSFLEYSRIKKITIQTWSPFQHGFFKGNFVDNEQFPLLNAKLSEIGEKYGLTKTGVAAAWILRHPANMQLIAGTMNPEHLSEICKASGVTLTRSEWYEIYRSASHSLP